VIAPDGALDRPKMRELAFLDPARGASWKACCTR